MIRVILTALALSTTVVLATLIVACFHHVVVSYGYSYGSLAGWISPKTVAVADGRVCYLYTYDIAQLSSIPTVATDLYRLEISSTTISLECGMVTVFSIPSNRSVSTQIFEISKSSGIELEKMLREELLRSNYTYYLPIISSLGYRRVAEYVEQVAVERTVCSPMFPPPLGSSTTHYMLSWSCPVSKAPSIGSVHVVEVCYDRGVNITVLAPGNTTSIDRAVDLIANATRYGVPDDVVRTLVSNIDIPLESRMNIMYSILLDPKQVHIVRALAFLAAFVSSLVLHYRFRPDEYTGFVRFFRRLRQRIGM